jgi:hypothetical protein
MKDGTGRSLSRREFDAVIRRAADLSSADVGGDGALTEAELFRIAGEVGLSDAHVRMALVEVRSGAVEGNAIDRIFGPLFISTSRVVSGNIDAITQAIDDFLVATQILQPVRRSPGVLQYRPAVDWASQLARAASFSSRKYYLASAKSVEVRLEDVGSGTVRVQFVVDPGTRGDSVLGAGLGGGTAGVGLGSLAGWALASSTPVGLAVGVGVVVGTALTGGITYATGIAHKQKLVEVQTEIEGVLDTLELGESLEPPPASWRRWVKRHFHGVARDVISDKD